MSALRVTHVITGLTTGGAENLLARVVEGLAGSEVESSVISLRGVDPLGASIAAAGVPVKGIGMRGAPSLASWRRLRRSIVESRPDVVQTWLLHANVIGGEAARHAVPDAPLAWGVHVAGLDPAIHGRVAAFTGALERRLASSRPAAIVACSRSAREDLLRLGYPEARITTILNGFDLGAFNRDDDDRAAIRAELGVGEELVVGHVARFHPMKDQANLIAAASRVLEAMPTVRFVLCGSGLDRSNADLRRLLAPLGDRVIALGERPDVPRLYRAFDVFALSSAAGEALPLVLGEAMSSEVPVVTTRCGDAPMIVGEAGRVVPIRDPAALSASLLELLRLPAAERQALGYACRERIEAEYSFSAMLDAYVELWRRLASSNSS